MSKHKSMEILMKSRFNHSKQKADLSAALKRLLEKKFLWELAKNFTSFKYHVSKRKPWMFSILQSIK